MGLHIAVLASLLFCRSFIVATLLPFLASMSGALITLNPNSFLGIVKSFLVAQYSRHAFQGSHLAQRYFTIPRSFKYLIWNLWPFVLLFSLHFGLLLWKRKRMIHSPLLDDGKGVVGLVLAMSKCWALFLLVQTFTAVGINFTAPLSLVSGVGKGRVQASFHVFSAPSDVQPVPPHSPRETGDVHSSADTELALHSKFPKRSSYLRRKRKSYRLSNSQFDLRRYMKNVSYYDYKRGFYIFMLQYFLTAVTWLYLLTCYPIMLLNNLLYEIVNQSDTAIDLGIGFRGSAAPSVTTNQEKNENLNLENYAENFLGILLISYSIYENLPPIGVNLQAINFIISIPVTLVVFHVLFRQPLPRLKTSMFYFLKTLYQDTSKEALGIYEDLIESQWIAVRAKLPKCVVEYNWKSVIFAGLVAMLCYLSPLNYKISVSVILFLILSLGNLIKLAVEKGQKRLTCKGSYFRKGQAAFKTKYQAISNSRTFNFIYEFFNFVYEFVNKDSYMPGRYVLSYISLLLLYYVMLRKKCTMLHFHGFYVVLAVLYYVLPKPSRYQMAYFVILWYLGPWALKEFFILVVGWLYISDRRTKPAQMANGHQGNGMTALPTGTQAVLKLSTLELLGNDLLQIFHYIYLDVPHSEFPLLKRRFLLILLYYFARDYIFCLLKFGHLILDLILAIREKATQLMIKTLYDYVMYAFLPSITNFLGTTFMDGMGLLKGTEYDPYGCYFVAPSPSSESSNSDSDDL